MKKTGYLAPEGLEKALLGELKNVYTNNMKGRKFGQEAPQNFLSGASDHCRRQGASEDKNYGVKPTPPKTDSLCGLCIEQQIGRLVIASGDEQEVYWAQNIWRDLQIIPFTSIGDAAKKLRSLQGLWAFYPHENIRRAKLIQEKLPFFSPKPLVFPTALPKAPLGSWTLLDANTLIASASCSSPLPHGEYHFVETKEPPSRAYLKLWEVFTRLGHWPKPGDLCLELGASPGSWTWVLSQLGAQVIAVDRAPLAKNFPNVRFLKQDAFQLHPKDFKDVKWVFSDLICYPEKLLSWIQLWLDAGSRANFICTLKFQGEEHYSIIQEFKKIPSSQIMHLFNNKHELTLVLLRQSMLQL